MAFLVAVKTEKGNEIWEFPTREAQESFCEECKRLGFEAIKTIDDNKVIDGLNKTLKKPEPDQKMIAWTRPMLKRFKKAFKQAEARKAELGPDVYTTTFMFDGNEFVVGYAKYLIEYLEPRLGK